MGPRRTIEKKTGSSSRNNGIRFASVLPGVFVVVHQCPAGAARETAHETDVAKIRFCRNAIAAEYDFAKPAVISEQAAEAIEWSLTMGIGRMLGSCTVPRPMQITST